MCPTTNGGIKPDPFSPRHSKGMGSHDAHGIIVPVHQRLGHGKKEGG